MKRTKKSKPGPLPTLPPSERGPAGRLASSRVQPDPNEDVSPFERPADFSVLDAVRAHHIKKSPFAEPILAIEILDGPYRGISFSFTSFVMLHSETKNGMVPTRYETEVHVIPEHLKTSFRKDEAFDQYTSEIVIAWLTYLHQNDLSPLIKAKPAGRYGVQ